MARFLPVLDDRDTGGFFAAAAEGRLVFKACRACGSALHLPVDHCRYCGAWDTEWREAAGTGVLHTWSTVAHQVHPDYPTPYTIVLVELDDARPPVRLLGLLPGEPVLQVGMRMEVVFEPTAGGPRLPQWRPAGEDGSAASALKISS